MPRKKNYSYGAEGRLRLEGSSVGTPSAFDSTLNFSQELGPEARIVSGTRVDLSAWVGRGIDEWVTSSIDCMRQLIRGGVMQPATAEARRAGLRTFFGFMTEFRESPLAATPRDLTLSHVRSYHAWLESRLKRRVLSPHSAHQYFSQLKSMMLNLAQYGYAGADANELFRHAAFQRPSPRQHQSTAPLSNSEQARLAKALKSDLSDSYHARICLRPSELITVKYVVVAFRVGESTVPLLELSRSEPREGPVPGTMILTTVKRRAHKLVQRPVIGEIRNPDESAAGVRPPQVIATGTAAVLRSVLAETEELVPLAPLRFQDRVWLYRKSRGEGIGEVTALSQSAVGKSIRAIVRRHDLRADDGTPLVLNVRRLRASFGHRAYAAYEGDIVRTADALGNTPRVVGSNYVPITDDIKAEGVRFMDGLVSRLKGTLKTASQDKTVPGRNVIVITPLSGCGDPINGEFAPKDGSNQCDKWVNCLFCPQFAVTGDEEELWRLFSFRWYAKNEMRRLVSRYGESPTVSQHVDALQEKYRLAIPFIGEFAKANFPERVVFRAERRSESTPHPFWVYQDELATLRR